MALKATIYKAELQIADMDRHYYADHPLTLAQHPSENDERMMVRLLAFALYASDSLAFGKGLCDSDEPDLWQKDLTGAVQIWIELGQPDDRRLRQISGKADQVKVFCYHGRASDIWWEQVRNKAAMLKNLEVIQLDVEEVKALAALAAKSMRLTCTIQDGVVWLACGEESVAMTPQFLQGGQH